MKTNKVAIIGSSGRLGKAALVLLSQKYQVRCADIVPSSETIEVDVRDLSSLNRVLEGVDVAIHIASLHAPHVGQYSDQEFAAVNVLGAENMAKACQTQGVSKLLYTSTTSVFNKNPIDNTQALWVTEDTPTEASNIYRSTKLQAEEIVIGSMSKTLATCVLRVSRCFPEPANKMAAYRLHRGVDARDIASAYDAAITAKSPTVRRFIISSDTPFKQQDCAQLMSEPKAVIALRCPEVFAEFEAHQWRFPDAIDRVYDNSLAKKYLGWEPRFGASEVLRQYDGGSSETLSPELL